MAETLIMVRTRLHREDVGAVGAYARSVGDALKGVQGFQGYGVWQRVQDPLARMVLFSYASDEAARAGLLHVSERRTPDRTAGSPARIPRTRSPSPSSTRRAP